MVVLGIILLLIFLPELISGFFGAITLIGAIIGSIFGAIFRIFN